MNNPAHWNEVISSSTAYLSDIDPIMAKAIERVGPCSLIPNPQLFETLVDAIISQQISVEAAEWKKRRLRTTLHSEANGIIKTNEYNSPEDRHLPAAEMSQQT